MIGTRIKMLRESNNMTQSELSKKLGLSRASVNAWEMGISVPSTKCVVELAGLFKVSTDFLLGVSSNSAIDLSDLVKEDVEQVYSLVTYLREKNKKK